RALWAHAGDCVYLGEGGRDQSHAFARDPARRAQYPRELRGAEQDRLAGRQGRVQSRPQSDQPAQSSGRADRSGTRDAVLRIRRFGFHRGRRAVRRWWTCGDHAGRWVDDARACVRGGSVKGSAFVPHDLAAPIKGADTGPLGGLTAAVKDMYDIAGEKTGGGNPEWLAS